jgi:hypothetical protein
MERVKSYYQLVFTVVDIDDSFTLESLMNLIYGITLPVFLKSMFNVSDTRLIIRTITYTDKPIELDEQKTSVGQSKIVAWCDAEYKKGKIKRVIEQLIDNVSEDEIEMRPEFEMILKMANLWSKHTVIRSKFDVFLDYEARQYQYEMFSGLYPDFPYKCIMKNGYNLKEVHKCMNRRYLFLLWWHETPLFNATVNMYCDNCRSTRCVTYSLCCHPTGRNPIEYKINQHYAHSFNLYNCAIMYTDPEFYSQYSHEAPSELDKKKAQMITDLAFDIYYNANGTLMFDVLTYQNVKQVVLEFCAYKVGPDKAKSCTQYQLINSALKTFKNFCNTPERFYYYLTRKRYDTDPRFVDDDVAVYDIIPLRKQTEELEKYFRKMVMYIGGVIRNFDQVMQYVRLNALGYEGNEAGLIDAVLNKKTIRSTMDCNKCKRCDRCDGCFTDSELFRDIITVHTYRLSSTGFGRICLCLENNLLKAEYVVMLLDTTDKYLKEERARIDYNGFVRTIRTGGKDTSGLPEWLTGARLRHFTQMCQKCLRLIPTSELRTPEGITMDGIKDDIDIVIATPIIDGTVIRIHESRGCNSQYDQLAVLDRGKVVTFHTFVENLRQSKHDIYRWNVFQSYIIQSKIIAYHFPEFINNKFDLVTPMRQLLLAIRWFGDAPIMRSRVVRELERAARKEEKAKYLAECRPQRFAMPIRKKLMGESYYDKYTKKVRCGRAPEAMMIKISDLLPAKLLEETSAIPCLTVTKTKTTEIEISQRTIDCAQEFPALANTIQRMIVENKKRKQETEDDRQKQETEDDIPIDVNAITKHPIINE